MFRRYIMEILERKKPHIKKTEELALYGGPKTVKRFRGKEKSTIGVEEFMAVAKLWGYSSSTLKKIREIACREKDLPRPFFVRYYNPRPSQVKRMEEYASKLFKTKYALGVNSGTSALITAFAACGIGPGDEVIVPAYTFFATVAAVVAVKAIPVIAEINDTLTIDPEDIKKKITPQTKAVIPVHMSGFCCDMDSIMEIANTCSLSVIEDNAQSCGGSYHGKLLGTIGRMGCFSLSSYKITGAGEAGMVLTDEDLLYIRAQNQHDTAACWRPDRYASERFQGELFFGQNYRMSEFQGAIDNVQLKKTKAQAKRYNTNMQRIQNGLGDFRTTAIRRSNDIQGDVGYNLVLLAESPDKAEKLIEALQAEGIPAGGRGSKTAKDWHIYAYWEHVMEQKTATPEGCPFTCSYYKGKLPDYSPDMCPDTMDLICRAVFIRLSQWWTAEDCKKAVKAINKVCEILG